MDTFYWYDLETFGIDPRYYRIAQFAGIRTDQDLNPIAEPTVIYCKPTEDYLPDPESCLVTSITPQLALQNGLTEVKFFSKIMEEFSRPNTCVAGYNNIRFDDEHIRYGFYRNLYDPYVREWKNGNSRWDIIDMLRLACAIRPEGINWPVQKDGVASFKLSDIASINNIEHVHAHDALSDVLATIAVAKLIRKKQPKLFQYVLENRNKHVVAKLLNIREATPVLHISSMYPASRGCAAVVVPLFIHPINKNGYIVYDLNMDPEEFSDLDVDTLNYRLFTSTQGLGKGVSRLPLKTIHINKCPIVAPIKTLDVATAQRMGIDLDVCQINLDKLKKLPQFIKNITAVFNQQPEMSEQDPDCALYEGFFNDADREKMHFIHQKDGPSLAATDFVFDDKRLPELFFRYKARNYPEILTAEETERWKTFCFNRLTDENDGRFINYLQFKSSIQELRSGNDLMAVSRSVLDQLEDYAEVLLKTVTKA